MRIAGVGHVVFAVTMAGLGLVGLLHPDWVPLWNPLPAFVRTPRLVVSVAALVSAGCGVGLLTRRGGLVAGRVLLCAFLVWLVVFRLGNFFTQDAFTAAWSVVPLLVMVAAVWVLCVSIAGGRDGSDPAAASGWRGLWMARVLFGLCLIFFGAAHFLDVPDTVSLIPNYLPWHVFWAYFTGAAFIAAGLAAVTGVYAGLAVVLAAVQIGLFLCMVWVPIVAAGAKDPFQWSETVQNAAMLAAAWVVADSYRGSRWVGVVPWHVGVSRG